MVNNGPPPIRFWLIIINWGMAHSFFTGWLAPMAGSIVTVNLCRFRLHRYDNKLENKAPGLRSKMREAGSEKPFHRASLRGTACAELVSVKQSLHRISGHAIRSV